MNAPPQPRLYESLLKGSFYFPIPFVGLYETNRILESIHVHLMDKNFKKQLAKIMQTSDLKQLKEHKLKQTLHPEVNKF